MALGVGAAIASAPGVASADTGGSSSPDSAATQSQRSKAGAAAETTPRKTTKKDREDRDRSSTTRDTDASPRGNAPSRGPSETSSTKDNKHDPEGADNTDDTDSAESEPTDRATTQTSITTLPPATVTPRTPAAPRDTGLQSVLLTTSASTRRPTESGEDTAAPAAAVPSATVAAAGSGNVVLEAESLTISGRNNGTVYTDPTASGGKAVVLNKNSNVSTTTTSAVAISALVIRARGDQYLGAPNMRVSVNGKVVSNVSVTATTWTDYTVPFTAPAGKYTINIAFTNDQSSKRGGDRNLRLDRVTVVSAVTPAPPVPGSSGTPGFFQAADWLWKPIAANPTLAANSSTWTGYLSASGTAHIANLYDYSVALVSASEVTSSTPRYDVTLTQPWGADPFGTNTVPIPTGTKVPPGSDGHVAILDPTTNTAYGIWQANYNSSTGTWSGSWGGMTDLDGNGIDEAGGSATAANIARYAGVVTAAEFSAALAANTGIGHALAFSSDIAGPDFVFPAAKSDGQNWAGVAVPMPEGYRIQLNPNLDIDAIPGMTAGERVIAKTLQTHGAYLVDQGAARMAFAFELVDDATASSPGSVWTNAGLAWDYYDMNTIPWSQLRVLAPEPPSV